MKATQKLLQALATLSSTTKLAKSSIYAFGKYVSLSGGLTTVLGTQGGAQATFVVESIGPIVEILIAQLGTSKLLAGMRVVSINKKGDTVVNVRVGLGEEYLATRVIVTVPQPMLKSISFELSLPLERISLEKSTQMGVMCNAVAVFDKSFWRERHGGEYIILYGPPRGFVDLSSPGGPGHLCLLVGGSPARSFDDMDPKSRRELLLTPL